VRNVGDLVISPDFPCSGPSLQVDARANRTLAQRGWISTPTVRIATNFTEPATRHATQIAGRRAVQRWIERSINVVPIYQLRCSQAFSTPRIRTVEVLEARTWLPEPAVIGDVIETSARGVNEVREDGRSTWRSRAYGRRPGGSAADFNGSTCWWRVCPPAFRERAKGYEVAAMNAAMEMLGWPVFA